MASSTPIARSGRESSLAAALPLLSLLAVGSLPIPVHADSTQAWCVFSRHDHTVPIEQGPCRWSQRQGNASVLFRFWRFEFPAGEEGRSYTRLNREGAEAGPVFTREGQYTLSVYWRQPTKEPGGQ